MRAPVLAGRSRKAYSKSNGRGARLRARRENEAHLAALFRGDSLENLHDARARPRPCVSLGQLRAQGAHRRSGFRIKIVFGEATQRVAHDIGFVTITAPSSPQGHFATGGMLERMLSTLPPVFSPNVVPRSYRRLNST